MFKLLILVLTFSYAFARTVDHRYQTGHEFNTAYETPFGQVVESSLKVSQSGTGDLKKFFLVGKISTNAKTCFSFYRDSLGILQEDYEASEDLIKLIPVVQKTMNASICTADVISIELPFKLPLRKDWVEDSNGDLIRDNNGDVVWVVDKYFDRFKMMGKIIEIEQVSLDNYNVTIKR